MLLVTSFHNIIVVTISCMRSYYEEIFNYNAQGLSCAYIRLFEDKAKLIWGVCLLSVALNCIHILHGLYV